MLQAKFKIGDKVFSKMRGYCPWPAKVEGYADLTPNKVKYHIYFYGTKQIAVCREHEMCSYSENKDKFGKRKKIKYFKESIDEIEADIENIGADVPFAKIDSLNDLDLGFIPEINPGSINFPGSGLLHTLKIECTMLDIQFTIQSNLTPNKANPELCLKCLDILIGLPLSALMIKKHSEVIDFLRELQNYVGNIEEWEFNEREADLFNKKSASIRSRAKIAHAKVQSLFPVPYGDTFETFFKKEVEVFKEKTKFLSSDAYYSMIEDLTL